MTRPARRALARVEWRQVRHHPRRAALVMLLVAVPVAAVVGGSTLATIIEPTAENRATAELGRAALAVDGLATHNERQRLAARLPADARVTRLFTGGEDVHVPGHRLRARVFALEPATLNRTSPATDGIFVLQSGRLPTNSGEVALAPSLLQALDRGVGQQVTLTYGPRRTITGTVVLPESTADPVIVRTRAVVEHGGLHRALITLPNDTDAAALADRLRAAGFDVTTRNDAGAGGGGLADLLFLLGVIGFFEAALVIAATFAVSLRRRRYEIGLLGATGATPRDITHAILIATAALALVGGLLGTTVGTLGAAVLYPWLDGWNERHNGPFRVPPLHTAGAILMGVAAAIAAAAGPARRAARIPLRVALGARRPPADRADRWIALGLTLILIGVGLLTLLPRDRGPLSFAAIVLGPLLALLGCGACSPWILGLLARAAARLPLAWRLAVRDAGRFRQRNGPVVTAVLAGMAMSVTAAILVASVERALADLPTPYRDDQVRIDGPAAERVATSLTRSVRARAPLAAVYHAGQPLRARFEHDRPEPGQHEWIACGDESLLETLGAEQARDAFRAGHLIAINPPEDAGPLTLTNWIAGLPVTPPPLHPVRFPQQVRGPRFILNQACLAEMNCTPGPPLRATLTPWLIRFDRTVTADDLADARQQAAPWPGTTVDANLLNVRPAQAVYYVALGLCLLTGVIIISIATTLSATESADDARVLHAIGASPGLLRRHRAAQAGYLALLGCVLAVPAGILPAISLLETANLPVGFVIPWGQLALSVLGLPILTFAGTWLLTRGTTPPARPVAWR